MSKLDCIVRHEKHFKDNPPGPYACIELPFFCSYCDKKRCDFEMVDGDGKLMCNECFEGMVAILQGIQCDSPS